MPSSAYLQSDQKLHFVSPATRSTFSCSIHLVLKPTQAKIPFEKRLYSLSNKIESHLKDSKLKCLQAQINPHFLFNSLNMITGTAYIEGAEETTNLMELLGSYLRYNLDKFDKMVTLKEEVENVRDYMEMQPTG